MKIELKNIKENQIIYFVWEKRRIAKVRAGWYDKESDELVLSSASSGIQPASRFNFYDKMADAAEELARYHEIESLRYSTLELRLRCRE
jgi:hypothetical protein